MPKWGSAFSRTSGLNIIKNPFSKNPGNWGEFSVSFFCVFGYFRKWRDKVRRKKIERVVRGFRAEDIC